MLRFIRPDLCVNSVLELGVERLRSLGLNALLLDVDCTLTRYGAEACSPEVIAWLKELREAGVGICLVSNGRGSRIRLFAEWVDLPFVAGACKPLPFGIRAAVRKMGFDPKRTAMVGDQLFADVMAGRLAGLSSILVRAIHPEEEPWFTRWKRPPERVLLRWMEKPAEER